MRAAGRLSVVVLAAVLAACASDPVRDRLMKEQYATYPEDIRHSIKVHQPMRGMTRDQLYLALGQPLCRTTANIDGKKKEVWMYPPGGAFPCTSAQYRIYFADKGLVEQWRMVHSPAPG